MSTIKTTAELEELKRFFVGSSLPTEILDITESQIFFYDRWRRGYDSDVNNPSKEFHVPEMLEFIGSDSQLTRKGLYGNVVVDVEFSRERLGGHVDIYIADSGRELPEGFPRIVTLGSESTSIHGGHICNIIYEAFVQQNLSTVVGFERIPFRVYKPVQPKGQVKAVALERLTEESDGFHLTGEYRALHVKESSGYVDGHCDDLFYSKKL